MWGSFLPKIIVPVAMSLLGKKFKQDAPKGGFMEGFGTSIAGLYTGKDGEIPTAKFEHLGSGGGSLIEAKIDALTSNLKLSNFKENFYGNSALTYLSQVLNAEQLRKSNTVDIGHRTASTKTSITPKSPTISLESTRLS
jgi:hypothetical protein